MKARNVNKKVVTVKLVRDDGKEFAIDGKNWKMPSDALTGFGDIENDITVINNAFGDGSTITQAQSVGKDRTVVCIVDNSANNELRRNEALTFFNIHANYKMYIEYMNNKRWCKCVLRRCDLSTGNVYKRVQLKFTMYCPSPYFLSVDDFGEDVANKKAMLGFPYMVSPATYGWIQGCYTFDRELQIRNDGDIATGIRVTISCTGEVINPTFTVNGYDVTYSGTLVADDVLIMDFSSMIPSITKNGENCITSIDRQSRLDKIFLVVGDNTISYSADSGDVDMSVSVYYNKQYSMI